VAEALLIASKRTIKTDKFERGLYTPRSRHVSSRASLHSASSRRSLSATKTRPQQDMAKLEAKLTGLQRRLEKLDDISYVTQLRDRFEND
jgi:hypothetical protein